MSSSELNSPIFKQRFKSGLRDLSTFSDLSSSRPIVVQAEL